MYIGEYVCNVDSIIIHNRHVWSISLALFDQDARIYSRFAAASLQYCLCSLGSYKIARISFQCCHLDFISLYKNTVMEQCFETVKNCRSILNFQLTPLSERTGAVF